MSGIDHLKAAEDFNRGFRELSARINEFLDPEITAKLKQTKDRLAQGEDLTEEEAREFVDTHLSGERWERHQEVVRESTARIDAYLSCRDSLVQEYGKDHEEVRAFDRNTYAEAREMYNGYEGLIEHTKVVHESASQSKTVQEEMRKRKLGKKVGALGAKSEKEEQKVERVIENTLESMLAQMEATERRLAPIAQPKEERQEDIYKKAASIGKKLMDEMPRSNEAVIKPKGFTVVGRKKPTSRTP